jgi:hypothetical protein
VNECRKRSKVKDFGDWLENNGEKVCKAIRYRK